MYFCIKIHIPLKYNAMQAHLEKKASSSASYIYFYVCKCFHKVNASVNLQVLIFLLVFWEEGR